MKTKFLAFTVIPFLLASCGDNSKPQEEIHYEVISVQPFYEDLKEACKDDTVLGFPEGVTNEADIIIEGGKNLAKYLNNVSYKNENNLKNTAINKNTFTKFGKNQVILLQTHGNYIDEWSHETFVTGEKYDEASIPEDEKDMIIIANEFVPGTTDRSSQITPDYVKKYCPDVSGSIVYMGQCHGGHDPILAQTFLDKGAIAVYGSTLQIHMHYGDMMQYRVTSLLGEVNPETNNYYTTGEALKKAQSEYGVDDSVKYHGSAMGARMILFGDPNFRLANK